MLFRSEVFPSEKVYLVSAIFIIALSHNVSTALKRNGSPSAVSTSLFILPLMMSGSLKGELLGLIVNDGT